MSRGSITAKCNCPGYPYPHRRGGGKCNWPWVTAAFMEGTDCQGCQYKTMEKESHGEKVRGCALLDNADTSNPMYCPGVPVDG